MLWKRSVLGFIQVQLSSQHQLAFSVHHPQTNRCNISSNTCLNINNLSTNIMGKGTGSNSIMTCTLWLKQSQFPLRGVKTKRLLLVHKSLGYTLSSVTRTPFLASLSQCWQLYHITTPSLLSTLGCHKPNENAKKGTAAQSSHKGMNVPGVLHAMVSHQNVLSPSYHKMCCSCSGIRFNILRICKAEKK